MTVTMGVSIRSDINRDTSTVPNDNKLGVYVNSMSFFCVGVQEMLHHELVQLRLAGTEQRSNQCWLLPVHLGNGRSNLLAPVTLTRFHGYQ